VATHSKTVTGFPSIGTTYYWRVYAGNTAGYSTPTSAWSVINGAAAPPETPVLLLPANGASVPGAVITFEWSAPATATKYWLEVNSDPAWGTATRLYYDYGDAVSHFKTVTGFPNDGTIFYWRVWAGNPAGYSEPTSGWSVHNP
jgi:hypothetical protein